MKKRFITRVLIDTVLFVSGGLSYGFIEILWRRHTHVSMLITGGACFLALYRLYEKLKKLTLLEKCVIGSTLITLAEFICGCIVNIRLKLNVWDYSHIPFNLIGQVCALYSLLWGLLCIPISGICNLISRITYHRFSKQKQIQSGDF